MNKLFTSNYYCNTKIHFNWIFVFIHSDLISQDNESIEDSVYIFIQHICIKVHDKAEFRQKVTPPVVRIIEKLSNTTFVRILSWLEKYCRNQKVNNTLLSWLAAYRNNLANY